MKQLLLPKTKNKIQRLQIINRKLEFVETSKSFSKIRKRFCLHLPNQSLDLGNKTLLMGIINTAPDSFSGDGLTNIHHLVLNRIENLIDNGADIIDIGGESSRPGAEAVSIDVEIKRVIPILSKAVKKSKIPFSVDTYKPEVAQSALDAGASIINNIMGCQPNKALLKMIKNYKAGIVLMHMRGVPKNMQDNISYKSLIDDIISELKRSIESCLETGIKPEQIIIDPGIGFGKTVEHNLTIINNLFRFKKLDLPILVGPSRKSFIGKILDREVDQRLLGTLACVCANIIRGAHIVRVHDVKESKEVAVMMDAIIN